MCAVCAKRAEIGIILDHSSSIIDPTRGGFENWNTAVLGFVSQLINTFPIARELTRVGIVGFSSNAWLQFGFDRYHHAQDMINAVRNISIRGGETNIAQVRATVCDIAVEFNDGTTGDLFRVMTFCLW